MKNPKSAKDKLKFKKTSRKTKMKRELKLKTLVKFLK